MVDDKRWVQQAQQGNKQAMAKLYAAYQPRIYRYIVYRVGETALAEDLTAELFVSMVKNLHKYEERGRPFLAWLYRMAGNIVKMHYRRQQQVAFEPLPEELVDDEANPAAQAQVKFTQERLMAVMPRLPEMQQQVILLKFIEGFSNSEVATLLDKSEGAIRVLQHRALAALRQRLAQEIGGTA